jgi:hypothetical protein
VFRATALRATPNKASGGREPPDSSPPSGGSRPPLAKQKETARLLLCLTLSLLLPPPLGAGEPGPPAPSLLEQAEKAFHSGLKEHGKPVEARNQFRHSAKLYEKLAGRGAHNPALFRNLGNAALLGGDLGGAVLAYQRGLRLAPDDSTLRAGLQAARERVANQAVGCFRIPPEPLLPPWVPAFTDRRLLGLTLVLYGLACVLWTRWWMTRPSSLAWVGLFATLLFAASVSALVLALMQTSWEGQHPLVVVAGEKVYLHKGDGAAYPRYNAAARQWTDSTVEADASVLPAGVEARLLFERGDWLQVRLVSGEVGWIPRGGAVLDR